MGEGCIAQKIAEIVAAGIVDTAEVNAPSNTMSTTSWAKSTLESETFILKWLLFEVLGPKLVVENLSICHRGCLSRAYVFSTLHFFLPQESPHEKQLYFSHFSVICASVNYKVTSYWIELNWIDITDWPSVGMQHTTATMAVTRTMHTNNTHRVRGCHKCNAPASCHVGVRDDILRAAKTEIWIPQTAIFDTRPPPWSTCGSSIGHSSQSGRSREIGKCSHSTHKKSLQVSLCCMQRADRWVLVNLHLVREDHTDSFRNFTLHRIMITGAATSVVQNYNSGIAAAILKPPMPGTSGELNR